jgi:hypothetical protein
VLTIVGDVRERTTAKRAMQMTVEHCGAAAEKNPPFGGIL